MEKNLLKTLFLLVIYSLVFNAFGMELEKPNKAQLNKQLIEAIRRGDNKSVISLINLDADINAQDINRNTPLFEAIMNDNFDLSCFLMLLGADVNVQNTAGETPLMVAIQKGNIKIIKLLIEKRANVDLQNRASHSALHWILIKKYSPKISDKHRYEIAKLLIANSCDLDLQDKDNNTALTIAIQRGFQSIARLLIENNANLDLRNEFGCTPLIIATQNNDITLVSYLLKYGASTTIETETGQTALQLTHSDEIIKLLERQSEFEIAVKKGDANLAHVQLLLKKNSAVSFFLLYPLKYASSTGNKNIVNLLIKHFKLEHNYALLKILLQSAAINGQAIVVRSLFDRLRGQLSFYEIQEILRAIKNRFGIETLERDTPFFFSNPDEELSIRLTNVTLGGVCLADHLVSPQGLLTTIILLDSLIPSTLNNLNPPGPTTFTELRLLDWRAHPPAWHPQQLYAHISHLLSLRRS